MSLGPASRPIRGVWLSQFNTFGLPAPPPCASTLKVREATVRRGPVLGQARACVPRAGPKQAIATLAVAENHIKPNNMGLQLPVASRMLVSTGGTTTSMTQPPFLSTIGSRYNSDHKNRGQKSPAKQRSDGSPAWTGACTRGGGGGYAKHPKPPSLTLDKNGISALMAAGITRCVSAAAGHRAPVKCPVNKPVRSAKARSLSLRGSGERRPQRCGLQMRLRGRGAASDRGGALRQQRSSSAEEVCSSGGERRLPGHRAMGPGNTSPSLHLEVCGHAAALGT